MTIGKYLIVSPFPIEVSQGTSIVLLVLFLALGPVLCELLIKHFTHQSNRGTAWGYAVALGYTFFDLFILKGKFLGLFYVRGCPDFCGVENIVIGAIAFVGLLFSILGASGIITAVIVIVIVSILFLRMLF